jgi:hypothetical protein
VQHPVPVYTVDTFTESMRHWVWCCCATAVTLVALTGNTAAAAPQGPPAPGGRPGILSASSSTPRESTEAAPRTEAAQTPQRRETSDKWEIEAHVGTALTNTPSGGSGRLPANPVSGPFLNPVWSSWYFGYGAAFFNDTIRTAGSGPPITALDPVLTSAGIERGAGLAVGFRVARAIDDRFSVEFTFDGSLASARLTADSLAGIEASSTSFEPAFSSLSFVSAAESGATIRQEGGGRLSASAALNFNLLTGRRSTPYVTVGGGVVSSSGTLPNATVDGRYVIPLTSGAVVDNTDTVKIRHEDVTSPVLVLGGGFKFDLTRRSGVRSDVRVSMRSSHDSIVIDALISQAGASLASPGPPINGFETFTGSGLEIQTTLSVGYFRRF